MDLIALNVGGSVFLNESCSLSKQFRSFPK